jgi:hypothetical protein
LTRLPSRHSSSWHLLFAASAVGKIVRPLLDLLLFEPFGARPRYLMLTASAYAKSPVQATLDTLKKV